MFSPIFILIFENYLLALKNIKSVISAKKTWIGYENSTNNSKLPKIKQAVFSVLDSNQKLDLETIEKINIIYAKDYNLILETQIFLKKLFKIHFD